MFNLDPQYIKVAMADREREAQRMRLVRQAKQARSEKVKTQGGRRRRISLRVEEVRPIRDDLERRVRGLLDELGVEVPGDTGRGGTR